MIEKRFKLSKYVTPSSVSNFCDGNGRMLNKEVVKVLNELSTENRQLKEERDALQKKTEMDKNDFFISEAKRMRLLAFIEDKALQKEYSEWERRIWYE